MAYAPTVTGISGLVSYWKLNETTGTVATDTNATQNGTYNGGPTLNQTSLLPADAEVCALFDGVNDNVLVGNLAALQLTTGTVVAWVKTVNSPSGQRIIVSKQEAFSMFLQAGTLAGWDAGGSASRSSGYYCGDNAVHMVAYRFASGVAAGSNFWADGSARGAAFQMTVLNQNSALWIGEEANGAYSETWGGYKQHVAVYNRKLTDAELTSLWNAGGAPTPPSTAPSTLTSLNLVSTFESIGVDFRYSNDTNNTITATVEYKASSSGTWITRRSFVVTNDQSVAIRHVLCNLIELQPNTAYDVRVTITDTDGVTNPGGTLTTTANFAATTTATTSATATTATVTATGLITTRAENIPSPAALYASAVRFVSATGSDAADGLTEATAWLTLEKVRTLLNAGSLPANPVVGVVGGEYARWGGTWNTAISLVAKSPAVDDNTTLINAGNRAVILPGLNSTTNALVFTGPAASGAPYEAPWVTAALVGPNTGTTYNLYRWACPIDLSTLTGLAWSSTRTGETMLIGHLQPSLSFTPSTAARKAEYLFGNTDYNYGAFAHGTDLYVRMPPNAPSADPNTLWLFPALDARAWTFSGDNSRLCGFHFRVSAGSGGGTGASTNSWIADHNFIESHKGGLGFGGSSPSTYGHSHVLQYNYFKERGLRDPNGGSSTGLLAWNAIKNTISDPYGSTYKPFGDGETGCGGGPARRVVIRRNFIDGPFNGFGSYNGNASEPSSGWQYNHDASSHWDVLDNECWNLADDMVEVEPDALCHRIGRNKQRWCLVFVSLAEGNYGPITCWDNQIFECSADGIGTPAPVGANVFKLSGGHIAKPFVEWMHGVVWGAKSSRFLTITNGGTAVPPAFIIENSVTRTGERTVDFDLTYATGWLDRHSWWASTSGLKYGAPILTTVADASTTYPARAQIAAPVRVNTTDGVTFYAFTDVATLDAALVAPATMDFTAVAAGRFDGTGIAIAGVNSGVPNRGLRGIAAAAVSSRSASLGRNATAARTDAVGRVAAAGRTAA